MGSQNDELVEEIEAINAIFDPDTVTLSSDVPASASPSLSVGASATTGSPSSAGTPFTTCKLRIPNHPHLSFLLGFDQTYPSSPPIVLGTASTGSRGEGKLAVDVLESILRRNFQPGTVCLFDVINEAAQALDELNASCAADSSDGGRAMAAKESGSAAAVVEDPTHFAIESEPQGAPPTTLDSGPDALTAPPDWALSDVVTVKKSVFVGRAAHVKSLDQAQAYLDHLLATEKKVASATHNISAWRIKQKKPLAGAGADHTETVVQDCDDDGETAAGGRLLHLMQLMDVWDVIVVVSRWYGGILLGPDRFRVINAVGRDALVKGGYVKEEPAGAHDHGKKRAKK